MKIIVNKKLLEDYQTLFNLKVNVNSLLEPLRKETKEIGSSSEASVEYNANDKEKEVILKIGEKNIKTILIVSSFKLASQNKVYHHKGQRCDRCWNYFDHLEEISDNMHVCHRCNQVIKEFE